MRRRIHLAATMGAAALTVLGMATQSAALPPVQEAASFRIGPRRVGAVGPTTLERMAGWRDLLADGLAGWQGTVRSDGELVVGPGWTYEDGVLALAAGGQGGDLVSPGVFGDLELQFEWRVAAGSNSGVKVRVPYDTPGAPRIGPEYQVLDDAGHANGQRPETSAAAMYDLVAPTGRPEAPLDTFRRGRIVARGDRLEHWLDGVRVVDVAVGSPGFEAARAASKFADVPDFGRAAGHIVLQDHGDAVRFCRVFVRDLSDLPGDAVELDLGSDLRGWSRLGDAHYTGDGSTITGEVTGGKQSFLITDRAFGDFLLEVDVKLDVAANSGIQVRSTVEEATRVLSGYQIEIDPTGRSWSGGLYDEMRRGWLDDLSEDAQARAAFALDGWNHYRIECIGPSLRAWVNGVPTADHLDAMTLEGVIGLQVHNGPQGRFRWRDLRVRDLGRHVWKPARVQSVRPLPGPEDLADEPADLTSWRAPGAGTWRLTLARQERGLSMRIRYAGDGKLQVQADPQSGRAEPLDARRRELSEGLQQAEDPGRVTLEQSAEGEAQDAEHVLEVHVYGDRFAVVQDGKTVADRSGFSGGGISTLFLEARTEPGQTLDVLGVDRLVRELR